MAGTYLRSWPAAAFAVSGIVLGALYLLWTYERVMFGPITNAVNSTIRDLTGREIAVLVPLMALMLFMGLYPAPLISRMQPSVEKMLAPVRIEQVRLEKRSHRQTAQSPVPLPERERLGEGPLSARSISRAIEEFFVGNRASHSEPLKSTDSVLETASK